jgi:non-heme chloroperoxidase
MSHGLRESFWLQGMMGGFKSEYDCIKAFSETDFTEDLKKINIPTLVMQGDDDQIVPFADSGELSSKLIPNAKLKVYKDAPHGLCSTHKELINEDLLGFIED